MYNIVNPRCILGLLPPQLSELSTNNGTPLDTRHHNLEAVEVVERGPLLTHGELLTPGAVLPLAVHLALLNCLFESLLVRHPGDLDDNIGKRQALEVDLGADHVRGVDKGPVLVNHVDDDDELAMLGAIVDQGDAPDLDEPAEDHGASEVARGDKVNGGVRGGMSGSVGKVEIRGDMCRW